MRHSKNDPEVRAAIARLQGRPRFGNPEQIAAARFLESTGLKFEDSDFERRELDGRKETKRDESDGTREAAGGRG